MTPRSGGYSDDYLNGYGEGTFVGAAEERQRIRALLTEPSAYIDTLARALAVIDYSGSDLWDDFCETEAEYDARSKDGQYMPSGVREEYREQIRAVLRALLPLIVPEEPQ